MKSLSLKNLKNLREHGIVLKGNYGVTALRNPNGSIAYRFQKRIKGRNAFEGTLGYYPQMSIKDAEKEALRLACLCERGFHPIYCRPCNGRWRSDHVCSIGCGLNYTRRYIFEEDRQ